MPDITLHLSANFYPPIPHDIQLACQEFFDEILEEGQPWSIADKDGNIIEQDLDNPGVLTKTKTLPNGAVITAEGMLDELRLWDALFWDIDVEMVDEDPELQYAAEREVPGQLPFWEAE